MRTIGELPHIPWLGRLSPPELSDAHCAGLVGALAAHRPTARAARPPSRTAAILGLALLAISTLALHESAPGGSLRALVVSEGFARTSSSSGVPEMKRMQSLMAGVLGAGAVVAGAHAQFNEEFTAWGNNAFGQCAIPTAVQLTSVATGNLHSLGITADARVIAWGSNHTGQCSVPLGLTEVVQVAAGGWYQTDDERGHSVALLRDGTVRAWGSNEYGQRDVPAGLNGVTMVACGWAHTAARLSDGSVVVWGAGQVGQADPHWGQRIVPTDLGFVTDVATKGCHIMAREANGTVRCWGRNEEGQCTVPAKLGPVVQIAAGSDHSIALLPTGGVRCWGWNHHGQSTVPADLGPVRQVAASLYGTIALQQDGQIVTWGLIGSAPTSIDQPEQISAGGYHAIALSARDCNANGIRDSIELATTRAIDSDGDSLLDPCDSGIVMPVLKDIVITRGTGSPVLPWPVCAAWDTRTEAGAHLWDLWVSRAGTEGPWLNKAEEPAGNPFTLDATLREGMNTLHCRMDPNGCTNPFFTANLWFDAGARPTMSGTNGSPIAPYSGVIPGLVPGAGVPAAGALAARVGAWDVRITNLSIGAAADQVGPVSFAPSGAPDITAVISISVIRACGGDVSQNGIVDGVDLAAVLGAWATNGHGQFECDIDGDGIVGGSDLAQVLGSWGPCP